MTGSNVFATTAYPFSSPNGGDITLNTNRIFTEGGYPDLYSVLLHELGHALGLAHSDVLGAVMYPRLSGVLTDLQPDDLAGIQTIYAAPTLPPDRFEYNDTFATATTISTSQLGLTLHSSTDLDFFRLSPTKNGTYTVSVTSSLSIRIYDGTQTQIASSTTGQVSFSAIKGKTYWVEIFSPVGQLAGYDLYLAFAAKK